MATPTERFREILADELAKLEKIPPHLIQEVRDGTHGAAISAAVAAMEKAVLEATAGKQPS